MPKLCFKRYILLYLFIKGKYVYIPYILLCTYTTTCNKIIAMLELPTVIIRSIKARKNSQDRACMRNGRE